MASAIFHLKNMSFAMGQKLKKYSASLGPWKPRESKEPNALVFRCKLLVFGELIGCFKQGQWIYMVDIGGMLAPETLQIIFLHELLCHPQVRQSQQLLLFTTQRHVCEE